MPNIYRQQLQQSLLKKNSGPNWQPLTQEEKVDLFAPKHQDCCDAGRQGAKDALVVPGSFCGGFFAGALCCAPITLEAFCGAVCCDTLDDDDYFPGATAFNCARGISDFVGPFLAAITCFPCAFINGVKSVITIEKTDDITATQILYGLEEIKNLDDYKFNLLLTSIVEKSGYLYDDCYTLSPDEEESKRLLGKLSSSYKSREDKLDIISSYLSAKKEDIDYKLYLIIVKEITKSDVRRNINTGFSEFPPGVREIIGNFVPIR